VITSTTTTIFLFLAFGVCFGVVTLPNRHLFSEGGSRKPQPGEGDDTPAGRVMWVLVCSTLWPIMALTGVYALWRRRRLSQARSNDSSSRDGPR
jgi:hypothetical protein